MKKTLVAALFLASLAGCATKQQQPDPRIGTDLTPHRSIPNYIECGDCRMPQK